MEHIFNAGDVVQHRATGHVGTVIETLGDNAVEVGFTDYHGDDNSVSQTWPVNGCVPYRDPAPVIEAARRLVNEVQWSRMPDKKMVSEVRKQAELLLNQALGEALSALAPYNYEEDFQMPEVQPGR